MESVSELLHFDCLFVGEYFVGPDYFQILKNDFSNYLFFRACDRVTAGDAVYVLLEYFSKFVSYLSWFSAQRAYSCHKGMDS